MSGGKGRGGSPGEGNGDSPNRAEPQEGGKTHPPSPQTPLVHESTSHRVTTAVGSRGGEHRLLQGENNSPGCATPAGDPRKGPGPAGRTSPWSDHLQEMWVMEGARAASRSHSSCKQPHSSSPPFATSLPRSPLCRALVQLADAGPQNTASELLLEPLILFYPNSLLQAGACSACSLLGVLSSGDLHISKDGDAADTLGPCCSFWPSSWDFFPLY